MDIIVHNFGVLGVMLILLCLSAFFSGTETAFFSINRHQLLKLEQDPKFSSKTILRLMNNPSGMLISVLFGNLTVNILFFCLSTIINTQVGALYGAFAQVVFGLIVLGVLIVCGEIMPKAVGIKFSIFISQITCYPLLFWLHISYPFRKVISYVVHRLVPQKDNTLSNITEGELKFLLGVSEKKGAINGNTSEMIEDIITLASLRAKHIMIPRVDIIQCAENSSVREAIKLARRKKVYLMPVYREIQSELTGYLDIKRLCLNDIKNSDIAKEYLLETIYVPETKNAADLLSEMQSMSLKVVFVVDEYGDIAGMITKDRILNEITGDIEMTGNISGGQLVQNLDNNTYRLQAVLSFNEWQELFANTLTMIDNFNVASIGGFVISLLGRNPKEGDIVNFRNLSFEVEKVEKNRIKTLILRINEK